MNDFLGFERYKAPMVEPIEVKLVKTRIEN